jgi:hypothetical protein
MEGMVCRIKTFHEGTESLKPYYSTALIHSFLHSIFLGLSPLAGTRLAITTFIHSLYSNADNMPGLLSSTLALASLALQASAGLLSPNPSADRNLFGRSLNVGMGTRYGLNCKEEDCWQQGACAFTDYTLPSTVDGSTCVSEELWDTSYHCGGCISVSYKGKKIVVMVSSLVKPI